MASRLRSLPVASVRRLCSGSGGGGATLSALIERLPVVTPELSEWEVEWREAREALVISRAKVYNAEFTAAEEGPERTRARLRLEQGPNPGLARPRQNPRLAEPRQLCYSHVCASPWTDRKLAERVYLLLQAEDGSWGLPQQPWAPPARARDGLQALIAASCGDELQTHQVGNTPVRSHGRNVPWLAGWLAVGAPGWEATRWPPACPRLALSRPEAALWRGAPAPAHPKPARSSTLARWAIQARPKHRAAFAPSGGAPRRALRVALPARAGRGRACGGHARVADQAGARRAVGRPARRARTAGLRHAALSRTGAVYTWVRV
eukprot:scaffold72311_cov68-Phaeocystis_antarctica.AAC.2